MSETSKDNIIPELRDGLETAFVNGDFRSNLAYRPEFLSNDYLHGKKVQSALERELKDCEEFCISVAFITSGGVQPFLMQLKELENRNIPGRILTTDYRLFSEPKALEQLSSFHNIELRMYRCEEPVGFHTKGYIFRNGRIYRIILGSSNLTGSALALNREWNTKLVSAADGQVAQEILREFEELWSSEHTHPWREVSGAYNLEWIRNRVIERQRRDAVRAAVVDFDQYTLKPNKMQTAFLANLMKLRESGAKKALFCSATATGKTIASAFALREMGVKKALFLVHREQIAKQAMTSYRRVFGQTITYGLISGTAGSMMRTISSVPCR